MPAVIQKPFSTTLRGVYRELQTGEVVDDLTLSGWRNWKKLESTHYIRLVDDIEARELQKQSAHLDQVRRNIEEADPNKELPEGVEVKKVEMSSKMEQRVKLAREQAEEAEQPKARPRGRLISSPRRRGKAKPTASVDD